MKLLSLLKSIKRHNPTMTLEEVAELTQMKTLEDCKRYMKVMLDFYFDVIQSTASRKASSALEDDRNIWLQQMFCMGNHFISLLDGVGYQRKDIRLNPIIDPDVLFTVARRIYESVVSFNLLFIQPVDANHQSILYNLFMAHGLSERLKDLDEDMRNRYPYRVLEEAAAIAACKKAIICNPLYATLNKQTQNTIDNAFGKKYRYFFNENDELKFVQFEDAYICLKMREDMFAQQYSFFSLHGHPSYLSIIQFRDAFKKEFLADTMMAKHATQCALTFLSIFIVDYMKSNADVKAMYDNLELPRRFAIGMYEDAMRGEHKFK